jgi:hypothetical protein
LGKVLGVDGVERRTSEGHYYGSTSWGKSPKGPPAELLMSGRGVPSIERGNDPASFLSPDPYSVLLNPSRVSIDEMSNERIAGSFEVRNSEDQPAYPEGFYTSVPKNDLPDPTP